MWTSAAVTIYDLFPPVVSAVEAAAVADGFHAVYLCFTFVAESQWPGLRWCDLNP